MIIIFSCITGLEPFHYVSLPSFSWDAGLLKTGETLEVIRDIDKCLFIDRLVDIYQVINNDNIWYVKTNQGLCVEVSVLWDIVMPRPTFQNWKKILTLQNVHLPYWEWTQQIYMDTWVTFTNIDSWKILLILFSLTRPCLNLFLLDHLILWTRKRWEVSLPVSFEIWTDLVKLDIFWR